MSVSVIIPTRNRRLFLQNCLNAVKEGSKQPDEVIVIDDASSDGTANMIGTEYPDVIVIKHPEQKGKSQTRNDGVKRAKSTIVAMIDDDCLPEKQWLEKLIAPFQDTVDFVIGETLYVSAGHKSHFPERIVQNRGARWPMTGNIAFRKTVFDDIGYFNSSYDSFDKEDAEFGIRAVSCGKTFKRAPDARAYHAENIWTCWQLFKHARNASVWPRLASRYPHHYNAFDPPIRFGIIEWKEFILLLCFPVFLPLSLIKFIVRGNTRFDLFFTRWPLYLLVKRLLIWIEGVRYRRFFL